MRRFDAKIYLNDLLGNSSGPYTLNSYFKQLNHLYHEAAITHDKGELGHEERQMIKHEWDDGEEIVRILLL